MIASDTDTGDRGVVRTTGTIQGATRGTATDTKKTNADDPKANRVRGSARGHGADTDGTTADHEAGLAVATGTGVTNVPHPPITDRPVLAAVPIVISRTGPSILAVREAVHIPTCR